MSTTKVKETKNNVIFQAPVKRIGGSYFMLIPYKFSSLLNLVEGDTLNVEVHGVVRK